LNTTQRPDLSIVILCYRSGESIIEFVERTEALAQSLTSNYQLVLVGNYFENSGDITKDVVEKLAKGNSHIKTVCKPKEGMMGWDMKEGLNNADGQYICVIDGDNQFPIESIITCYEKIKTGGYDLVKTYRSVRNDGAYRRTISFVYNTLFRILFPGFKVSDVNSKPKMFKREAYSKLNLKSDDWFIDAEIMILARRYGFKFYEFPVEFAELHGRKSFVKVMAIVEFFTNLLKFRLKEFFNKN
jgi:glycosyltransferase involved in cell wall biosynthesis